MTEIRGNSETIYKSIASSISYFNYINSEGKENNFNKEDLLYLKVANASLLLFLWRKTFYENFTNDDNIRNAIDNLLDKNLNIIAKKNKDSWQIKKMIFKSNSEIITFITDNLYKGLYKIVSENIVLKDGENRISIRIENFITFIKRIADESFKTELKMEQKKYLCIPIYRLPKKDFKINSLRTLDYIINNLLCLQYTDRPISSSIKEEVYDMRLKIVLNSLKNRINTIFINKKDNELNTEIQTYVNVLKSCDIDFNCDAITSRFKAFKEQMHIFYQENKDEFDTLTFEEQKEYIFSSFINFIREKKSKTIFIKILLQNLIMIEEIEKNIKSNMSSDLTNKEYKEYDYFKIASGLINIYLLFILGLNNSEFHKIDLLDLYNENEFDYSKLSVRYFYEDEKKYNNQSAKLVEDLEQIIAGYNNIKESLQRVQNTYNEYLQKHLEATLTSIHASIHEVILELQSIVSKTKKEFNEQEKVLSYSKHFVDNSLNHYLNNKEFIMQIIASLKNGDLELTIGKNYNENILLINFKNISDDKTIIFDTTLSIADIIYMFNKNNIDEILQFIENNNLKRTLENQHPSI